LNRTFSIELARNNQSALYVALHPRTVYTTLSARYYAGVSDLLTPEASARRLLTVIDDLTASKSGRFSGWDGPEIVP